jgi:hypothetical protein
MILKKGRLASLRAVRRGLGVAAGYLSSGTLWAGFEFRIASRKPRSSGLARSGAILPLSAAGKYLVDHSDALSRKTLLDDTAKPVDGDNVVALPMRR